jgi:DNA-binding response OmpR family regulator
MMPGMSGAQVVQEFAARGFARRYLYMSGFQEGNVRLTHVLGRRVPLLPKPFSPSQLIACVRQVLQEAPGENSARCA